MRRADHHQHKPDGREYLVANNATTGTNIAPKMVFNKPLNPTMVSNSTFSMYLNDTGQWIPLTVSLSTNGMEVTLTPQISLSSD